MESEQIIKHNERFEGFSWPDFWEKSKWQLVLIALGLGFVIFGFSRFFPSSDKNSVKITPLQEAETSSTIWIDLAGAVEKPGVYELPNGARLNDLLIKAGGLSSDADRQYLGQKINLAQKLTDGAKIYIPYKNDKSSTLQSGQNETSLPAVSLNTASLEQLDILWGIGPKRAQDIIANRPFQSIDELKTKKILPENVFEKIKSQLVLW